MSQSHDPRSSLGVVQYACDVVAANRANLAKDKDHTAALGVQRSVKAMNNLAREMRDRYIRLVWENPNAK